MFVDAQGHRVEPEGGLYEVWWRHETSGVYSKPAVPAGYDDLLLAGIPRSRLLAFEVDTPPGQCEACGRLQESWVHSNEPTFPFDHPFEAAAATA